MRPRKPPKDLANFDTGVIAASQLIHLAMERILFSKSRVRWSVTVRYYQTPEEEKQDGREVVCTQFSASNAGPQFREKEGQAA